MENHYLWPAFTRWAKSVLNVNLANPPQAGFVVDVDHLFKCFEAGAQAERDSIRASMRKLRGADGVKVFDSHARS